jgi:CheY-like chemotaxis protein
MAKVLLVEDDNNLREIYEARLQAEGYEISSAQDGEQALVVAKQFKPDLVISDVMMPKISGFEMLDILRNTEGLKNTKVIMLTALGQAEDKTRADSLGADRYLVKSQVTLEDIIRSAHDVLDGDTAATPTADAGAAAAAASEPAVSDVPMATAPEPVATDASSTGAVMSDVPVSEPPAAAPADPVATSVPAEPAAPATPPEPPAEATPEPAAETPAPAAEPAPAPEAPAETPTPEPAASSDDKLLAEAANSLAGGAAETAASEGTPTTPENEAAPTNKTDDSGTGFGERVIQPPAPGGDAKPSLEELLAREEAKEAAQTVGASVTPTVAPAAPTPQSVDGIVAPAATPANDVPEPPAAPGTAVTPQPPAADAAPAEQPKKNDDFNPHDISL